MYDGNPVEIDFGSSQREVRVSEDSSYRESTEFIIFFLLTTSASQDVPYSQLITRTKQLITRTKIA